MFEGSEKLVIYTMSLSYYMWYTFLLYIIYVLELAHIIQFDAATINEAHSI